MTFFILYKTKHSLTKTQLPTLTLQYSLMLGFVGKIKIYTRKKVFAVEKTCITVGLTAQ